MKIGDAEVLTLAQAAERIGVSPITLQQQIRKGALHGEKMGKQWVVTADELRRYADERLGKRGFASPTHPFHGKRPPRHGEK
jgi:excisionase family DNA binding protein